MSFDFLRTAPVNLLRYLPRWLARDPAVKSTLEVCGDQHEKQRLLLAGIARQFFVATATWGLVDWERMLNIPTVRADDYGTRRRRILLKLQDSQTSSLPFMTDMINRYTTDGTGYVIEHSKDYAWELVANADTVIDWHEMITAVDVYKPAHLAMLVTVMLCLPVEIKHSSKIKQHVKSKHNFWQLGVVRTVCFDGNYALDRTLRWDGIYGEVYREQQRHTMEIRYTVETWQRNLVPVNVWDGDFEFTGGHSWSGSPMQRLPLHKSMEHGVVEAQQQHPVRDRHVTVAMNCPDVYLPNPIKHGGNNQQCVSSPQQINPGQIAAIAQTEQSTQQQIVNQATQSTACETSQQKMNIENRSTIVNEIVTRQNTDYRTANLADGSFCMDGTHAFEGARQQNYAGPTHCCVITRITKDGYGRSELS